MAFWIAQCDGVDVRRPVIFVVDQAAAADQWPQQDAEHALAVPVSVVSAQHLTSLSQIGAPQSQPYCLTYVALELAPMKCCKTADSRLRQQLRL